MRVDKITALLVIEGEGIFLLGGPSQALDTYMEIYRRGA